MKNILPINTLAFEIKTLEHYELAVAICPSLSEITFEAVEGHFFALSGSLRFATIPPAALAENQISIVKGETKDVPIVRFTRS